MKRRCGAFLLFWGIFFISLSSAFGSGFLIIEHGSKSMGMAGAFTAIADDPSTIFNNPAGITQLPGSHVAIGNTFVRNDQGYEVDSALFPGRTYHEEIEHRTFFLPHLYLTHQMNDKMTFGFGYYSPFGIGTNWSDRSVGNSTANETHIKTYDFNPNLAVKLTPKLSLAVGVHYLRFKTQIIREVGAETFLPALFTPVSSYETFGPNQLGRLKLDARGDGVGYNVGALYKLSEFWKVGFHYRSDIKIEISRSENTVEWFPSGNNLLPLFNPILRTSTHGKAKIGLPGIFFAGISTTAIPQWTVDLDFQYTTWNHFNDLVVDLKPGLSVQVLNPAPPPAVVQTTSNSLVLEEDWENTWSFHLGAEHRYTDNFAVRAGYFYDKTPIPDRTLGAILPGSDRHNFSLGCGYTKGEWTLDLAYLWSNFENRSTRTNYQNFNTSYESNFHLLGFTVTKKM